MRCNNTFPCHINNLNYSVDNFHIIKNLSFKISEKPITIISGPNGIGKTTLLKILAGIINPCSGNIEYRNGNFSGEISFLLQNTVFFNTTLLENLLYIKKIKKLNHKFDLKLEKYLNMFELNHLLNRYPSELSGGEQQIFSFIRSLLQNPTLFFLDEPFQNLDREHKKIVENIIENISLTCKIIMVSHDYPNLPKASIEILKFNNDSINQA